MRKLKSLIAVASLLVVPVLAMPVSAADCTITNTGPGSNNTCTDNTKYTCKVDSDNKVVITNGNEQVATSGSANGSGNTEGGAATSGSATNSNGTTFNYTVSNEGCVVTGVVTPQPETPVGGSGGAGETTPVVAKPTVLARTSGESALPIFAGIAALLAAGIVAVRSYGALQNRS